MNAVDTLEKFGESYQSKVIAALLSDLPFLNQVSEITNKDYFESEQDKWIVESILDYQSRITLHYNNNVYISSYLILETQNKQRLNLYQILTLVKNLNNTFSLLTMDMKNLYKLYLFDYLDFHLD